MEYLVTSDNVLDQNQHIAQLQGALLKFLYGNRQPGGWK